MLITGYLYGQTTLDDLINAGWDLNTRMVVKVCDPFNNTEVCHKVFVDHINKQLSITLDDRRLVVRS
jgi:hypothetical protein